MNPAGKRHRSLETWGAAGRKVDVQEGGKGRNWKEETTREKSGKEKGRNGTASHVRKTRQVAVPDARHDLIPCPALLGLAILYMCSQMLMTSCLVPREEGHPQRTDCCLAASSLCRAASGGQAVRCMLIWSKRGIGRARRDSRD